MTTKSNHNSKILLFGLVILTLSFSAFAHGGSAEIRNPTPSTIKSAPIVGPFSTLYERSDWKHWIDEDHDCQDTRAEILIARSTSSITYRNEKKCSVVAGTWFDPFSGKTWTQASDVDIVHIVPLAWAHGHGGQLWDKAKKRAFANDRENLLIVEDNLNQEKGSKSPDEWLPPNHDFRCEYIQMFDLIVSKYELNYIASEKRTILKMLTHCPNVRNEKNDN